MSVDPGIELGLTVFVTSRRYRQTNSAQVLRVRVRVRTIVLSVDPGIELRVRVRVEVSLTLVRICRASQEARSAFCIMVIDGPAWEQGSGFRLR